MQYGGRNERRGGTQDEFYSFGDFFSDLDKEIQDYRSKRSGGKPMSLWEELEALGEEFVEFLEIELEEDLKKRTESRSSTAMGGDRTDGSSAGNQRSSSNNSNVRGSSSYTRSTPSDPFPRPPPRPSAPSVDDELAALKKKLGL